MLIYTFYEFADTQSSALRKRAMVASRYFKIGNYACVTLIPRFAAAVHRPVFPRLRHVRQDRGVDIVGEARRLVRGCPMSNPGTDP